jgi:hypothetical protein
MMMHPRLRPTTRHMTRQLHRIVAAVFAVWFTVFTVQPASVHSCPTHGGAAHGGVAQSAHAGHVHHAGMATTNETGGAAAATHAPAGPDHQSSHRCTCPDAGCCSAVLALVPFATPVAVAGEVAVVASFDWRNDEVVERGDHVLPFPTAPPVSRLA